MSGRLSEFAVGTGRQVLVDASMVTRRGETTREYRLHKDPICLRLGPQPQVFPTEKIARATIPGSIKPCRYCR